MGGFPNKTLYPEFKARYNIMAAGAVAKAKNDKAAAQAVMDVVKMDKEKYRLGHTKVFFRAGIAGKMEEFREDKIGSVLSWLQSGARGKASRMQFKKLEDKIALAEANIEGALEARSKVQAVYDGFMGQKNELSLALKSGGSAVQDIIDKTVRIENAAADVKKELEDVKKRIKSEKDQKNSLEQQMQKINATVAQLQGDVGTLEGVLASAEQDRANKDDQIRTLKDEIAHQSDMIGKLSKEKRSVGDREGER